MSADTLAARFRRLIAATGPITVQHFMGEALAHYYATRDPLGVTGDFVTAPEVSQMFGEMIGAWLADVASRSGHSGRLHYVELGPGRGTLAADALRVLRRFGIDPEVHLVEGSPALRAVQAQRLGAVQWHDDLASVPDDAPLLLVANEFLDALPVRQLVRTANGWRERMVALDGERFVCVAGERPMDAAVPAAWRDAAEGAIIETCPGAAAVMAEIGARLAAQGGAALVIDYGYAVPGFGSSLQAVRGHAKVDPFVAPGSADLTALVDFAAAAEAARGAGARVLGLSDQGDFLRVLGIAARAAALAKAAPDRGEEIAAALDRLTGAEQMGALFKVLGLAGPGWPDGAGFVGMAPASAQ
ncbi:MAG: SAM-dependent methyltransferase [Sphingomonadales bacterium]|nr:SAM-dependent methyltransferase [Sphingomonadales bacterium]